MYLKHKLCCLKDWSVTCLCLGCSRKIKNLLMPERYNDVFVTLFTHSHDYFSQKKI